jgi:glutamate--cysteine ligase
MRDPEPISQIDDRPILSEADVELYVNNFSFKIGEPKLIGAELEWIVLNQDSADIRIPPERTMAIIGELPLRGSLSCEPGGQLELSTIPADLQTCISDTMQDITRIENALATENIKLSGLGLNPYNLPHLYLDKPRYTAMQQAFDRANDAGRWMLCNTASVQIALDAGQDGGKEHDFRKRWRAANAVGPILVAAFSNSPVARRRLTGWRSTRQAIWSQIDLSRTKPPPQDMDPCRAWTSYALDAQVVCIRRPEGEAWTAPPGLTFGKWIADGSPHRPTLADLRYHLTTLFPPIRPRGYLELRMIDAQCGYNWVVAIAVTKALLDDTEAIDLAMEAAEPLNDRSSSAWQNPWLEAARCGLSDPMLGKAAIKCFEAAQASLSRMAVSSEISTAVQQYADTYVYRGRSPADDLIEIWHGL